ncbi:MAG: glycosyltransferase family 2 protein [Clostridia bacterium]|nr:glycosyltransferase family 2 protein [Clostridia bacterium]
MADVTAIILTKDEERNIERCLRSVENFAARRVVVDSGSTDRTVELARSLGAEVLVHPFENYARQFNWGVEAAGVTTKWVLRLDADECFPDTLCRRLEKLLAEHAEDDVNGLLMESNFYFLGRKIRFGGPKKRKIMIYRAGFGSIEDRRMDEHTVVEGGRVLEVGERFDHYDFKDLTSWVAKLNWYATREMQDYIEYAEGIHTRQSGDWVGDRKLNSTRRGKFGFYYRLPMFWRCWMLTVYNYIFRLGFLDGKEGFVYHWMYQRWYRTLVDAKILEYRKDPKPFEATGALGAADVEGARRRAGGSSV